MQKTFVRLGALLAGLSVILGAFGAHALKQVLTEKGLSIFETAVRYQMYHAFGLLIIGILFKEFSHRYLIFAGQLFCAGILLFSGSLYLLSYIISGAQENLKWIGAVTPLGGVCFILGWIFLALGIKDKN